MNRKKGCFVFDIDSYTVNNVQQKWERGGCLVRYIKKINWNRFFLVIIERESIQKEHLYLLYGLVIR